MTGGSEFQEAAEAPQEVREVSEVKEQLDRAAFEPEEVMEKTGEIKESEALQDALKASVDAIPVVEKTENPPAITLEGSAQTGKVTIEKGTDEPAEEGQIPEERTTEVKEAGDPALENKSAAAQEAGPTQEQLDSLGGESQTEDEFVLRDPDGSSDGDLEIDMGGLENTESIDFGKPTDISDAYAGGMGDAERGEGVGYMGGEPPEGGGGGKDNDTGLPGPDQMGEMGELAGMAAFGADGRISDGGDLSGFPKINIPSGPTPLEYPSGETKIPGNKGDATGSGGDAIGSTSGVASAQTFDYKSGSSGNQGISDGVSVNVSAVSKSGSSGDGGAKPPADDSTPAPDDAVPGHVGDKDDPTINVPTVDPLDYAASMMQPVGPEGSMGGTGPPPDLSGELEAGLNQLINWGDEGEDGDEEFVGNDVDILGGDTAGGGEGIEDSDGISEGFEDIDP